MESIVSYPLLAIASAALFAFVIFGAIYRLYLSPLSSFPGPKLAALTLWYEFYYDVILDGQYFFHLVDLHARYGPIIRINPYELHFTDSEYYDKLYASGASGEKRNKWSWFTKQFDTPGSMLSTDEHGHHKIRRAALNRFFSSASVKRLQPMIDEKVFLLVKRLREVKDMGKAIRMNLAFSAMTNGEHSQFLIYRLLTPCDTNHIFSSQITRIYFNFSQTLSSSMPMAARITVLRMMPSNLPTMKQA